MTLHTHSGTIETYIPRTRFHTKALSKIPAYLYRWHLSISPPAEARELLRIIAKTNFPSLASSTIFNLKLHVVQIREKIVFFRPFKLKRKKQRTKCHQLLYDLYLRAQSSGMEVTFTDDWGILIAASQFKTADKDGCNDSSPSRSFYSLHTFYYITLDMYIDAYAILLHNWHWLFKETSLKHLNKTT